MRLRIVLFPDPFEPTMTYGLMSEQRTIYSQEYRTHTELARLYFERNIAQCPVFLPGIPKVHMPIKPKPRAEEFARRKRRRRTHLNSTETPIHSV
jgi:hypothetical protein